MAWELKWEEQWVETFALLLLALGFVISILIQNVLFSLISVFLAGFVAGRVFYIKRNKEPILPFVLMIIGFLLGYWLGSVWVDRVWTLVFFGLGFGLSYYLHLKKILVIFKNENFLR